MKWEVTFILGLFLLSFVLAMEGNISEIVFMNNGSVENANINFEESEENGSSEGLEDETLIDTSITLVVDRVKIIFGTLFSLQAILEMKNGTPLVEKKIDFYDDEYLGYNFSDEGGNVFFELNSSDFILGKKKFIVNFSGDEKFAGSSSEVDVEFVDRSVLDDDGGLSQRDEMNKPLFNESEYFYWDKIMINNYFGDSRKVAVRLKVSKELEDVVKGADNLEKMGNGGGFSAQSASGNVVDGLMVEMEIRNLGVIKSIEFRDLRLEDEIFLGVEDLSPRGDSGEPDGPEFVQSYAIDPSLMNFSDAVVSVVAKGEELYKCKDWNFSLQECYGEWVLFRDDLVVGEEYSFILTQDDPGFGEILQPNETEGVDTFLNQNAPSTNYGDNTFLVGSESGGKYAAALIKFNLSHIPNYSNITNAKFKMYFYESSTNTTNPINLSIRRITSDWNESDVAWVSRPSYTSGYSDKVELIDDYGWVEWDVGSVLQSVINGSFENYGIAVVPDLVSAETDKRFYSSDYSNVSLRPQFIINYTADNETPVVNLEWPENNTQHGTGDVIVGFNVTDESEIANCSLRVNGSIRQTKTSVENDTLELFRLTVSSDNYYDVDVVCFDVNGNQGLSHTASVTINSSKADIYGKVQDSNGVGINSTIEFFQGVDLVHDGSGVRHAFVVDDGVYDIVITPENYVYEKLIFYDVNVTQNRIKVIDIEDASEVGTDFLEVHSIDPSNFVFDNATVTIVATGDSLYKCEDWNFSLQECYGDWVLFRDDLVPGEEYNFTITSADPGFGEINATNAIHLNENYSFVSNVFDEVEYLDGNWSEKVYENEFVRVTYELNLSNESVIDIYVRNVNDTNTWVEIYNENTTSPLLGKSQVFNSTGEWSYITLGNMSSLNDVFDFKIVNNDSGVVGFLEFDYIHDAVRTLTDVSLISSSLSIAEGEQIDVVGYYATSATGGPTGDVRVGLNDTNNNLLLDLNCSAGDTFKVGSIVQNLCVGCTDNGDGTITFLNPDNNENFNVTFNLTACADSSDLSPANLKTYELTATGAILDNVTGDITISGAPTLEILYPLNGSTYNTKSLFIKTLVNGNSLDSCWYNLNEVGNVSYNCSVEPNITAVENYNNLSVYVNNSAGYETSDFSEFYVNSSIPLTISITSPENGSIKTKTSPELELLAFDTDFSLINYTLYIYNETGLYAVGNSGNLTNNSEIEITLSPALILIGNLTTYRIVANATDGVNNASSNVLYYTLTNPSITLVSPDNGYWDGTGNISFSFKVYDEAFVNISCSLLIDGVLNQTNDSSLTGGAVTTFDVVGISEGVGKTWEINCTDPENNTGEASRVFNVDKTDPVVNWINDSPDPVNAGEILNITANVTDNFGVDYVIVNVSGAPFFMSYAGGDIYYYEYNTSGLSGSHNYTVRVYDNVGNFGENDSGSFDVNIWDIVFNFQSPPDIDSLNIFSDDFNISYNVTSYLGLNASTVRIYSKTNSSFESNLIYVNGSVEDTSNYIERLAVFNNSETWYFTPYESGVYPATYNYDEWLMEEYPNSQYDLDSTQEYLKVRFFNVTGQKQYSVFEIYASNQTENSTSLGIYYCNSSYVSGNPVLDNSCVNFYNLDASSVPSHYHGAAGHYVIPVGINASAGKLDDVVVTNTSYFLLRGVDGVDAWDVYYIENVSREDTIQASLDSGLTWSNFSGTVNAHLHQYNGTEIFRYYVCANDTYGNQNCSEERIDLLDFAGLPPTSPSVYAPMEGVYYRNITINYTASYSPNGYDIDFYNISLVDLNETFIQTIKSNNSLNLSYIWDSTSALDGDYYIRVEVCDNLSQCSYGYSENVTINNSLIYLYWFNVSEYPVDPAYYVPGENYEFNISWESEIDLVWIDFDGVNYTDEVVNYSGVYHFNISNLSVGVHNYTWYANNSFGEMNYSVQNYTVVALPDYRLNGTVINGTGDALNVSFKIYNSTGSLLYENDENFDYVFSGVEKYDLEVVAYYDDYVNRFWLNGLFNNSNLTNAIYAGHDHHKAHCIVDPTLLNYDTLVMEKKPENSETQIFDKCNGAYNLTTYTCNGTWEPWYNVKSSDFANYSFAWGDPALRDGSGTFFEDWETGLLTTNNWSSSGGGSNNWIVVSEDPYAGIYHAQAEDTDGETVLVTNISTVGYENISFDFWYDTDALDAGEYFRADWYNGTDWINVLDVTATNTVDYTKNSNNLTSDASNNSDFAIRFRCSSNANNEECKVDNVFVDGIKIIDITLEDYYGLNSSLGRVNDFNTSNLEEIEYMELNFSIRSTKIIDSWYFNFTANGTNGCSLGNKQSSVCYNYSNSADKWIQFINGTETVTYDGTQGNAGDRIEVIKVGSGNQINVSLKIDEHYNPNVFKWYDALYNFSDVKWQNGVDQRITKNKMLKIEVNQSIVPLDADQYKLDFRVNYSAVVPTQPLLAYACNSSYTTGLPEEFLGCALVVSKLPNDFQDDGTKFRGIFTNNLIDQIGDFKYIILYADLPNPNRYYFIKTYNSTVSGYTTHWEYTGDQGASWINLGDGYETELNINWFYNGVSPTAFVYSFWVNTTNGIEEYLEGNVTWNINATNNYPPLTYINSPIQNETLSLPYNVTFVTTDPNDDNLNVSLYLYQGEVLNKTLVTGMNQSNFSFYWDDSTIGGLYNLTLVACELGTVDLFCFNSTHEITVISDTCTYPGSGNWEVNCSDNCSITSNVDLLGNNISIVGEGSFWMSANITNWSDLYVEGVNLTNRCEVYCLGGGCFT